jgi:hypothetical protein
VIGSAAESPVTSAVHASVLSSSFLTVSVVPTTAHLFLRKRRALRGVLALVSDTALMSLLSRASAFSVAVGSASS